MKYDSYDLPLRSADPFKGYETVEGSGLRVFRVPDPGFASLTYDTHVGCRGFSKKWIVSAVFLQSGLTAEASVSPGGRLWYRQP